MDTTDDDDGHDNSELLGKNICPYSGFQGRIGGIKGCWVVDDALKDIRVQCRPSQVKYRLYQKSVVRSTSPNPNEDNEKQQKLEEVELEKFNDPAYDTVEICSWDVKPSPATFNTRLVQSLEAAGLGERFFLECVENAAKELSKLRDDNSAFLNMLKVRQSEKVTHETENRDGGSLYRMLHSKVNECEPILTERKRRYIMKDFAKIHEKVRFCYALLLNYF